MTLSSGRQRGLDQEACPICGDRDHVVIGVAQTIDDGAEHLPRILGCRECSHWWTVPTPAQSELDNWYGSGSPLVLGPGWEDEVRIAANSQEPAGRAPDWVAQSEERFDGNGRSVIELGPGDFGLLRWLESRGSTWQAIEVGAWTPDDDRIVRSIGELAAGTEANVVIALDVLEHVADPLALLKSLTAHLAQGATSRAYVSFPNSTSLRAFAAGTKWRMVRPYGHLHYFSSASARRLLQEAGLEALVMSTGDLDPRDGKTLARIRYRLRARRIREAANLAWDSLVSPLAVSAQMGDQWNIIAVPIGALGAKSSRTDSKAER